MESTYFQNYEDLISLPQNDGQCLEIIGSTLYCKYPIPNIICKQHKVILKEPSDITRHLNLPSHSFNIKIVKVCSVCQKETRTPIHHLKQKHLLKGVLDEVFFIENFSKSISSPEYIITIEENQIINLIEDEKPIFPIVNNEINNEEDFETLIFNNFDQINKETEIQNNLHIKENVNINVINEEINFINEERAPTPNVNIGNYNLTNYVKIDDPAFKNQIINIINDGTLESVGNATKLISNILNRKEKFPTTKKAGTFKNNDNVNKYYWKQKKRALREVTNRKSYPGKPTRIIVDHLFPQRNYKLTGKINIKSGKNKPSNTNITPEEVVKRLERAKNTSPGIDQIMYKDLKKFDPDGKILAQMFNICLSKNDVPNEWKKSKLVLIAKCKYPQSPSDYRPISLQSCLYKTFSGIIGKRLLKWAEEEKLFSYGQKGFRSFDGCHENNFILKTIINNSIQSKKSSFYAFLDLENFFNSIPHPVIYETIEKINVGNLGITIKNIYQNQFLNCKINGENYEREILSGTLQGDPLSPIIANFVIENLLQESITEKGIKLFDTDITHLAYADDIVFMSNEFEALQNILEKVGKKADELGLKFKPAKSATLSIENGEKTERQFKVQNQLLPFLKRNEPYKYLGVKTIFEKDSVLELLKSIMEDAENIEKSELFSPQKLDAYRVSVMQKLNFIMRQIWMDKETLKKADINLRKLIRKITGLQVRTLNDAIYLPCGLGGTGLFPIEEQYIIQSFSQTYKILNSPDPFVRNFAINAIYHEASYFKHDLSQIPEIEKCEKIINFLENKKMRATPNSSWNILKKVTNWKRTKSRFSLKWFYQNGKFFSIATIRNGDQIRIDHDETRLIRHSFTRSRMEEVELRSTTKGSLKSIWESKISSNFIRKGKGMSQSSYKFAFAYRTQTHKLKDQLWKKKNEDVLCRKCKEETESMSHVQGKCPSNSQLRIQRHGNIIVDLFSEIKKKNPHLHFISEGRPPSKISNTEIEIPTELSNLRPDLIIIDPSNNKIQIVDVKCIHPSQQITLESSRQSKIQKYSSLGQIYRDYGFEVSVEGFIVGNNGAYPNSNYEFLRYMGLSKRETHKLSVKIVNEVIRISSIIYFQHISENIEISNIESQMETSEINPNLPI